MPYAVIQTHPHAANVAVRNLRRQDFEYYDPRIEVRCSARRARAMVTRVQLFPDYLFVKIVDRWRALKSTYGVRCVLECERNKPALLSDVEIERLRMLEDFETGCIVLNKPKFEVGEKVQIEAGPFALASGLYDGQKDRERVFVLLNILGAKRRVEINERDLVAA